MKDVTGVKDATEASLLAQMVKRLPAMRETQVQFLGREDPLEKTMAIYSSTLAWKIPWMEEPDRLQSMGSQRVGHDWATSLPISFHRGDTNVLKLDYGDSVQLSKFTKTHWTAHLKQLTFMVYKLHLNTASKSHNLFIIQI